MYKISDYGAMMVDQGRMQPYVEALRRAIKPGDVVIDLGAGTGIFSLLACRFGACKVYAIDPNPALEVARALAEANGLAGRIEFIQDLSTNVELPEKAQIIVSDLRGLLPLYAGHIETLADARRRLLAEGGILIPERDVLWAVVVNAPGAHGSFVKAWDEHNYDFDLSRARQINVNLWSDGSGVKPENALTSPQVWTTLDYQTRVDPNVHATLQWSAETAATAHGFAVWFDPVLYDGVGWSNAPGRGAEVYGRGFFPWTEAVALAVGDRIEVELQANLVGEDYVWSWKTNVTDVSGQQKAAFNQSTFFGSIYARAALRRHADDYTPTLKEDGALDHFILGLIDGRRTQAEIAAAALARFPQQLPSPRAALDRVVELAGRYGR